MDHINQEMDAFIPISKSQPSVAAIDMCANLNIYRKNKYKSYKPHFLALSERCKVIQQDNERLVNRIQQVTKQLRRTRVERNFIMNRLDTHGDNWRNLALQINLGTDMPKKISLKHKRAAEKRNKKKKSVMKFAEKRDPNMPKRPANPFFKFCQEQRPIVRNQIVSTGESEPTKQDLTKLLAVTWNNMEKKDKKVYYDMYQKSRVKYNTDMKEYTLNKSINTVQTSKNSSSQ